MSKELRTYNYRTTVAQRTDYYPSGLPFPNMLNPDEQPFKYNEKEFDTMHGLNQYEYGVRFLDPAIGPRWMVPDPLAEKYYSISPYTYCANNPMRYIDLDGREIRIYYEDEDGKQKQILYSRSLTAQQIINNQKNNIKKVWL
jgi:RHS repeat-associated protein